MSEYLQYFYLNIHYKSEKSNIISDALFQLPSDNDICEHLVNWKNQLKMNNFILKVLQINLRTAVYVKILMKVSDQLWQNIKHEYDEELKWEHILQILERNNALRLDTVRLSYEIRDNLIFYKDLEKGLYLCILKSLYDRMFKIVYDNIDYSEYVQTHKRLTDLLYFYDLLKNLHKYIQDCSQCQLSQTLHYKSYDVLQSIITSSHSFHMLTIDFILTLSLLKSDKYNIIMSVTDKFSKAITLISDWDIIMMKDWAITLLNCLALLNWGLSKTIILN